MFVYKGQASTSAAFMSGRLSPARTRHSGSQQIDSARPVSTHESSSTSCKSSAGGHDVGRPTSMRTEGQSSADLKAICGELFDEFHIDPEDLAHSSFGSMDAGDTGSPSDMPPDDLWRVSKDCSVQDVMIPLPNLAKCGPKDIIKDIVGQFAKQSGLPVVSDNGTVVGMITRKVLAIQIVCLLFADFLFLGPCDSMFVWTF